MLRRMRVPPPGRAAVRLAALLLALPLGLGPAQARDKSDRITVANGDTVHGEIKELRYGYLAVSTDSFGTIKVEWPDVRRLASEYDFIVETNEGTRHYGRLLPPAGEGSVIVQGTTGAQVQLRLLDIAEIRVLESRFWDMVDGSVSVGFNAAKSTGIRVGSARLNTQFQGPKRIINLTASVESSGSDDGESNTRTRLSFDQRQVRAGASFGFWSASYERNDQLGLDGRLQLGAGGGRYLLQTPSSNLTALAGLTLNQEESTGEEGDQVTVEALLGADWRIFRFADPETALTSSLSVYPSLSESGRYRSSLDVSLRRELVEDLFLDLSFYGSYDSEAPDAEAASTDWGINTSLGYSF